jgi:heme-degrading monooxygenase HmoA
MMHARVGQYHFVPEQFAEVVRIMREELTPAVRDQPGYRGMLLLADEKTSKAVSISIWESEAAMRASEGSDGYFQESMKRLSAFFQGSAVVEHYDVSAQT